MFRTRKARKSAQARPLRFAARPSVESLDRRELLTTASPFIQGTAFVDVNNNGIRTPSEVGLANATVKLYLGSTLEGTATTDPNGNYLFNSSNVAGGLAVGATYKLVESAAGYSNTGAQALSQLDPASVTATNAIQVTVVDPNAVTATFTGPTSAAPGYDVIYYTYNGVSHTTAPTLLNFSLAGGGVAASTTTTALCVGLTDDLGYSPFPTILDSQSALPDGGQIAYLYNQYGVSLPPTNRLPAAAQGLPTKDIVAGLQVAIWDLEYNTNPASPAFVPTAAYVSSQFGMTAQDFTNLTVAAAAFVADSAGKSQALAVLDASLTGTLPTGTATPGGQSLVVAESFNFGNAPSPRNSISGVAYVDATGVGLTGPANSPPLPTTTNPTLVDTVESGVTVSLFAPGSTTPIATTTTNASGAYSFTNLAPGTYSVHETTPGGYVETFPVGGTYTIPATGGGVNYPNNNFANFMESCNSASLTNVVYKDNGNVIPGLRGNTHQGDTVSVTFTVPSTTPTETLSLVAYSAPGSSFNASNASQQAIVGVQTATFTPGTYTETVTLPNSYYQVDFVCGAPITQFGPAGSNLFYSPQGRLIDADNGGTQAYALSTISGTVYADGNNNDTLDGGDAGLGGITVYLANGAGTAVLATTTTASNGTYSFGNLAPGSYIVAEVAPTGYTGENPNPGVGGGAANYFSSSSLAAIGPFSLNSNTSDAGNNFGNLGSSISGTIYVDATGIGLTTANAPPAGSGDTAEAGVTVDLIGNGAVIATTTTASNGTYAFTGLPYGTYGVAEVVPTSQYQTGPNSLTYTVTTTVASPSSTGDNFSNYLACNMKGLTILNYVVTTPAGVSTTVTNLRGNTAQGDTVTANFSIAPGSAPVQLSLVAYEAPTSSYSPSNAYLQVITSVATGTYGPGTYSQTVTLPNSYYQVDFACGAPLPQLELNGSRVDYQYENRLDSADNGGTQAYALSTLSGTVYVDANGNGSFGPGEVGLGGVTVSLYNSAGTTLLATTTTASNGTYTFSNLAPATYVVTETPPSGYVGENPNAGTIGGTASYNACSRLEQIGSINLNSNTAAGSYNFGQFKPTSIAGTVYNDKNFDDALDCSDTGLGGVAVSLETTNGTVIATTTTASNGTYSFNGLAPGVYQVVEAKACGYVLENGNVGSAGGTAGVGSVTSITLTSGTNATSYNLAEFKQASPCGYYGTFNGQCQIAWDCGSWWSTNLGNWLAQNCSSLCGSGSNNLCGQNNWSVLNFCVNLQNQYGANSMQCEMLTAALDEYFGKC